MNLGHRRRKKKKSSVSFEFPGRESSLLHCRQIFYCLSHQGSTKYTINSFFFFFLTFVCVYVCGILVPRPGMELRPLAEEALSFNHCQRSSLTRSQFAPV